MSGKVLPEVKDDESPEASAWERNYYPEQRQNEAVGHHHLLLGLIEILRLFGIFFLRCNMQLISYALARAEYGGPCVSPILATWLRHFHSGHLRCAAYHLFLQN